MSEQRLTKSPEKTKQPSACRTSRLDSVLPFHGGLYPILKLQRTIGNQAVNRLLQARTLQAKLAVSQPGDVYEQEADRVADQVMRMPDPAIQRTCAPCAAGGSLCPKCAEEKNLKIQRTADSSGTAAEQGVPDDFVRGLGPGQPLDPSAQAFFEPRFGADFSQVRVHTGSQAVASARAVNALAYTVGRDVVFGAGQYTPQSGQGRHLLAHELTHVVQQTGGPQTTLQRACATADQESRKTNGCIQPVLIADDDGTNPTTAPSFNQVQAIWGKCCINYLVNASKTVNKTAYKTLEESPNNTPSAEERALFADAGSSACIQVFVPATFSQGADTGKHISGGGGTYDGGTAHPKIVVVEGAASEVVAHEVGHATGYLTHDANDTVMKPTGAHDRPNATAVSLDVCTKARTGSVLVQGAPEQCCMTFA